MTETTAPSTTATPPPEAAADMAAALADPAPPQPSIDTSEYDACSSYVPTFAVGTHVIPAVISAFEPSIKQDDGSFMGWKITANLTEEFPDDSGGQLPAGHRITGTIFTQESQYRTTEQCVRDAVINLQGLNQIVRDKAADPRFAKADATFKALPADKKLPGRSDTEPSHYANWVGTHVKLVVTRKGDNLNINSIMAYATPAGAQRR